MDIVSNEFLSDRPPGQSPSHQTPPALPHTPDMPHSNQLNPTSQSAGIIPDHVHNLFRPADASIQGSSHSHFSSSSHQSPGMGLPSIMNATPMNAQPSGPPPSSGYTLPPIPQQPQTQSTNLPPAPSQSQSQQQQQHVISDQGPPPPSQQGPPGRPTPGPLVFVASCPWSGAHFLGESVLLLHQLPLLVLFRHHRNPPRLIVRLTSKTLLRILDQVKVQFQETT